MNAKDIIRETMQGSQEDLNSMIERRIAAKISNGKETVNQALERFTREGRIQTDHVAGLGVKMQGNQPDITFDANGVLSMNLKGELYKLHPHAIYQTAHKMGIPSKYLTDLATGGEWEKQLAQKILNTHSNWTNRERVLVRAVGDEVRGVLSDRYKRLNSMLILTAFFQSIEKQGGVLIDGFMDDTRVNFEAIHPTPVELQTPKNGVVTLAFGTRIQNSDYGDGALSMRSFVLQGICLNGYVSENILRQVHLGAKLPDNLMFSEETYRSETKTSSLAVRDITEQLFTPDTIKQRMTEVMAASSKEVDAEKEVKKLNSAGSITKAEGEEVIKTLVNNNPNDGVEGQSTLWKLVNGITAVSREKDERRKRELEEIAGSLMPKV